MRSLSSYQSLGLGGSLGEDGEAPDRDLVRDLVAEAATALQASFDDVFVRQYDVQFSFDDRKSLGDFRANQESLISGDGDELFEAVETADDIDDDTAPIAWGECEDDSRTSDAAMVFAGTSAAAVVSASAASCASAGAAAGAGATGGGAC